MKKNNKILVTVSALAMRAWLAPTAAHAQLVVSCPVPVRMGQHIECGSGNGRYRLQANGTTKVQSGCIVVISAAQPGQCVIKNGTIPVTKNITVQFPDNRVTATNTTGDTLSYRRWRISTALTNGNNVKTRTFTPADIAATITLDVGTRIHFTNNQGFGSYITTNSLVVTEQ